MKRISFMFKKDSKSDTNDAKSDRRSEDSKNGTIDLLTAEEATKYIDEFLNSDFNFNYFLNHVTSLINSAIKNAEFAVNIRKNPNELYNRRLIKILSEKGYRVYDNNVTVYSKDDYENVAVLTVEYYK